MSTLDLDTARWLVSDVGLETVDDATELLDANQGELAVVAHLRDSEPDHRRTAAAVEAARCRIRARQRWPDAERLLFTREALEQASDPDVSAWRARRFTGLDVVDLCASVGGDAMAIAGLASTVCAIDLDEARLVLLGHNAAVRGLEIPTIVADAVRPEDWRSRVPADHVVHVDPARRVEGRRVVDPRRTVPAVDRLVSVHGARPGLAIVLAPGVDADHPALVRSIERSGVEVSDVAVSGVAGPGVEVEYLQLGDDLVEAVAWYGRLRDGDTVASATMLPRPGPGTGPVGAVHRARSDTPGPECPTGAIGENLIEVAVAAVRARLHDDIGRELGARRVAHHRALLTLDGAPPPSPWYRARPVLAVLQARPGPIRAWLAANDQGPVEIALHGARVDPIALWRAIGRPPRGPGGIRIEVVRRDDDQVAVVTRDLPRGTG